ncbi:glycosyltransferase [Trichlorobacter lovleyi]|uniref:glycosyltransferase n=1 Tax=Trichlorobacter lovleyi TaxID=313985 RepID=UPI00223EBE2D|nr:glycosyltransferase [Trichlorobacter lovleyi]QOX78125.1 glycosyltransferase [Trichlorobacter lovleyi]
MTTPTFDIIVPAWNSPTETRACLVSILDCSPIARMIIINNGCDRTTELMLEEFCDHLGERALYITMERNIGFVPAVNRALARSDADWALIVRPTGTLSGTCFQQILATAGNRQAGIITPHCPSEHPLPAQLVKFGCAVIETCDIGFSLLALSKAMRDSIGLFDEELDSGPWCLRDYRHRADAHGFRTCLLPGVTSDAEPATIFGSRERRRKQEEAAITTFRQRWGEQQHVAIYLPKDTEEAHLHALLEQLLAAARRGHRLELFLHRRQYLSALQHGAACLHCGVTIHRLSLLSPLRSLTRGMAALLKQHPGLQPVCGLDGIPFPGYDTALPATTLTHLAHP